MVVSTNIARKMKESKIMELDLRANMFKLMHMEMLCKYAPKNSVLVTHTNIWEDIIAESEFSSSLEIPLKKEVLLSLGLLLSFRVEGKIFPVYTDGYMKEDEQFMPWGTLLVVPEEVFDPGQENDYIELEEEAFARFMYTHIPEYKCITTGFGTYSEEGVAIIPHLLEDPTVDPPHINWMKVSSRDEAERIKNFINLSLTKSNL